VGNAPKSVLKKEVHVTRLTIDDVYEYAHGVCFKTGPPGTVGAETEWFVVDRADPTAHVPLARVRALIDAVGPPPRGSRVTYEPGGQLELSTAPFPGPAAVHQALTADLAHVRAPLSSAGLALAGYGVDPLRTPLLQHDDARYRCMKAYFRRPGLAMMCTTASVQVCLDIGADHADARRRWRLAHALGPVLVAAFANSPLRGGRRTGLKSTRQAIWAALDPCRTAAPVGADPARAWGRYALDARVMLVRDEDGGFVADPGMTFREWVDQPGGRRGRRAPEREDLVYHLSTLFPPVRPRGWLELRMIDAVPEPYWPVPVVVAAALLDDPRAADAAAEAVEPAATRWAEAARDALTDPVLATAARRCFAAALEALPRLGAAGLVPLVCEYAARYVERGRCPADDALPAEPRSDTSSGAASGTASGFRADQRSDRRGNTDPARR
jgi:glutamate--cysteine ligase